jgi:glycosyltransferase involved in cell wall biosynthesis
MSLYIDLTEFLTNPITTGIQRVAGEICKYMPPNAMIPVRLNVDHYEALSPSLLDSIGSYFRERTTSALEDIRRHSAPNAGSPIQISQQDTILVPEAFGQLERFLFFRNMPEREFQRCRFFVHDMLPLTHPQYFPPDMPAGMCTYFNVVRRAYHCGFNSEYTRDTYYGRLKRTGTRDGVVFPLGSDALGTRAPRPTLNRALNFIVLGTIEPRKNHELILEAFEPLLGHIAGLTLTLIGKMGWVEPRVAHKVHAFISAKNPGVIFRSGLSDTEIRSCVEQARATIYVSSAEGFGLPPVESLWTGTPVIASHAIPSLENLKSLGIHYVEPLTALNLRKAVLAFLDDNYANRKAEETVHLDLPTWRSFTVQVIDWCAKS